MSGRRLAVPDNLNGPIYKGYVNKQGGNHKSWKTRYTILYPHLMVYYENSTKYEFDIRRYSLENRKNHIILEGGQIGICRSSDEKLRFAFTITARSSDNKRGTYVIANSNESDRALWMDKVTEAINGCPKQNPKSKLLTKQSTLRLLDSDTAESVRGAMQNKGGESDIDDTDSEPENDPIKRSAKSHHLGSKSKSTAVPDIMLTAQDTIDNSDTLTANKARNPLSKDLMTTDVSSNRGMGSMDESAKSRDDLDVNSGIKKSLSDASLSPDPTSATKSFSTEEVVITWPQLKAAPTQREMMLGKEGFLYKQGGKHKTWKHRYVVAVPGRLAYYKSKLDSPGDKAMGVVKLKNVVCSTKPSIPKYNNLFEVTSNSQWNKRGTYLFSASTSEEREEWLGCLEILGGDCKAHIEELKVIECNKPDPVGAERRALSFVHEVSQSIDEDDLCPRPKPPSIDEQPEDSDTIPGIEPHTTKTKRHREGKFDLDISFITDRILVMSFPYTTQELATFQAKGRNQIDSVERFLSGKYNKSYRVYNLCNDMKYPATRFNGNIGMFPFEDHCPPALSMMQAFLKDMQEWMSESGTNVSVVHCNSGKGRSGCMVASYLIYAMGIFYNEAIELFNTHRINFGSGLSMPSHLRYIKYIDRIRLNPTEFSFDKEDERVIENIQLRTPALCDPDWKPFITIVSMENNTEIFNSMKDGESVQNLKTKVITIRKIDLPVKKDVQINIWNCEENVLNELSLVAYLFFHTSFVGNNIVFSKQDLDKLFKSKMQGISLTVQFKEEN